MGRQIARLFVRGSLFNNTIANLTDEQKKVVDDLIEQAWNDPELQNSKHAFCLALSNTIGFEYRDKSVAMQEARIALWKAAALALYHKPNRNAVEKPRIRRKFMKTILMNYMKQIISENKIPTISTVRKIHGPPAYVAKEVLCAKLAYRKCTPVTITSPNGNVLDWDRHQSTYILLVDSDSFPDSLIRDNQRTASWFSRHGASITYNRDSIVITATCESPSSDIVYEISENIHLALRSLDSSSFDSDGDGSMRYHMEYEYGLHESGSEHAIEGKDFILTIVERLPDHARRVAEVITNTPEDYVKRYGTSMIRRTHLADYLGITVKDINRIFMLMRAHCSAYGISKPKLVQ